MIINNRVEVVYIPTEKFKTGGISISICDNLCRDRAYKNALIPMILCRGTKNHPTSKSISEEFQALYSADFATSTDKKGEIQIVQFAADFIEEKYAGENKELPQNVVKMLLEIITDPVTNEDGTGFKDEYFTQERKNNNDFIKALKNDKRAYSLHRCREVMCQGENYSIYEMGAAEDGDGLTAENLYDYYRNYFLSRTVVKVFVCCREEPVWLYDMLRDFFVGTDPEQNEEAVVKLAGGFAFKEQQNVKNVWDKIDVAQGKLNIGFRTNVEPESDDFYALAVCNGIFGAGPGSKLFKNVREKNSLAYYAASRLERMKGLMIAYSGIDACNRDKAVELIINQLDEIKKGNVTQEEYDDTVKMFVNSYNSYKDTVFSIMDFHLGMILLGTDLGFGIDEFIEKIKAVKLADVIRVSQKIEIDTIYFLGPDTDKDEGGKDLAEGI